MINNQDPLPAPELAAFRRDYPYFGDETVYTDHFLWLCRRLAEQVTGFFTPCGGDLLDLAWAHLAHCLSETPESGGVVASASQGDISVSFRQGYTEAGFWGTTAWGKLFWEAVRKKGGHFFAVPGGSHEPA